MTKSVDFTTKVTSKPYNFRKTTKQKSLYGFEPVTQQPKPPRGIFEICPCFKLTFTKEELKNQNELEKEGLYYYEKLSMPFTMSYINKGITDICVLAIVYGEKDPSVVLLDDVLHIPHFSSWVKKNLCTPHTKYKHMASDIKSILIHPKLVR